MRKTLKVSSILMFAAIMLIMAGCSSKGLDNGVYHGENDSSKTITITDLTDDIGDSAKDIANCKKKGRIQFSDNYDFSELNNTFCNLAAVYYVDNNDEFKDWSYEEQDKKIEEVTAEASKSIDLKKQLSDRASEFYLIDIEDNDFDAIIVKIEGTAEYMENDMYLTIEVYDDGHLVVENDTEIFTR